MKDVQSYHKYVKLSQDTHEFIRKYLISLKVHIWFNFLIVVARPTWKFNIAFPRKTIVNVMLSLYFMWVNAFIFW